MLTAHEIFGFMSPALATQILASTHETDRPMYRAALNAVAEARKVRPIFLERQPRAEQHTAILSTLTRPALELVSANLLRNWLVKQQKPMLVDFLNTLGIPHEEGVVDDLPKTMDDQKLSAAVEALLAKYPHEHVAVYLLAFNEMNEAGWSNLKSMLDSDPRLQLGVQA